MSLVGGQYGVVSEIHESLHQKSIIHTINANSDKHGVAWRGSSIGIGSCMRVYNRPRRSDSGYNANRSKTSAGKTQFEPPAVRYIKPHLLYLDAVQVTHIDKYWLFGHDRRP